MMPPKSLSPVASRLLGQARRELSENRLGDAENSLASLQALAPDDPDVLRLLGVTAQLRGDHARAIPPLRKLLTTCPEDAKLHMALGIAQFESGDIGTAIASLHRASELEPGSAAIWFNLGKALKLDVQTEQAVTALRHALALDAGHVLARLALADALASLGHIEDANAEYRQVLERQPDNATAWLALANLKTAPFNRSDMQRLEQAHASADASGESRILLGFAMARALEDRNDAAAAFEMLTQANALQRRRLRWDAAAEHARVEATLRAFATLPSPDSSDRGREVILIVGLPRSGTTLIEQILASHPQVEGSHEILDLPAIIDEESRRRQSPFPDWVREADAEDWARLGGQYLARTERWRRQRPRFTDKNLVNWKYLGAALRMLPGAQVVSIYRDPLETCLGCWRQWFAHGAAFSYDLDEMAAHYADYHRLRHFWQQAFPEWVFGLSYEGLLADPEHSVKSLLDFCRLPFDRACLAFHATKRVVLSAPSAAQVRQPLRQNTARGAFYGKHLDRLRERLREAGVSHHD